MNQTDKPEQSNSSPLEEFSARHAKSLAELSRQISQAHGRFLDARQDVLRLSGDLARLELAGTIQEAGGQGEYPVVRADRPALVTATQLREFAEGDIFQCLSPAYRVYEGRRTPRIPNRDLLVMSRVTSLTAIPRKLDEPSSIETEFDVPVDAWFLRQDATPDTPYSILMEMALQPCGFLTAYLETPLDFPEEDFFFRNLDGEARLLRAVNLRGKTITNRSRLLKTSISSGVIVQKFEFELLVDGQRFYEGQSVFGYFPALTMLNQAGLEGGTRQDPWLETGNLRLLTPVRLALPQPAHRLDDLDEVTVVPNGGIHGQGYVYARKQVDPEAWFFSCHFKDDPVMPGSLGIESVLYALRLYGQSQLTGNFSSHHALTIDNEISWKYRGQIVPSHKTIELEVHIGGSSQTPTGMDLWGDASLWVDRTRIYRVNRAALRLTK